MLEMVRADLKRKCQHTHQKTEIPAVYVQVTIYRPKLSTRIHSNAIRMPDALIPASPRYFVMRIYLDAA